jgi:diacylglycerol kinase (ATP)
MTTPEDSRPRLSGRAPARQRRVAAIFGPGSSPEDLKPFQLDPDIEWTLAISPEARAVLILGGDGTVHRHLPELVESHIPMLVVPRGSGNDFARALGIRKVKHAIAAWREFCATSNNVKTIDLGMISNAGQALSPHLFCCVAGVGLDSEVAEAANRLPRWLRRKGGYLLSLLRVLPRFEPLPIRVSTKESETWKPHSAEALMLAAFANTSTYGAGFKIAPLAKIDDGQLDVCLIHAMNYPEAFCLFPTIYFGQHLRVPKVNYFQAQRARIDTETPLTVYADGEPVCTTPVEISIRPKALQVIVPGAQT